MAVKTIKTIQLKGGSAAAWTAKNPVLAKREMGLEMDTRKFKVGDGTTAWNDLSYWTGGGADDFDVIDAGEVTEG